jgi:glutamine amidotransferase
VSQPSVAVLDYGSGNLRSAQRALERAGAQVSVTADPERIANSDGLVVPGVGAYAACMDSIQALGAGSMIAAWAAADRPLLGICVGMQVMFDSGEEHGVLTEGLGLLPGRVTRLRAPRVPHMGWNVVAAADDSRMFAGIPSGTRYYFVHSYAASPAAGQGLVSLAVHGEPFVAAVEQGRLWATQFHPEKSGAAGALLLRNWVTSL